MNVRIFRVRAMKCMCAQTRPRFILSSEGVLGGMEFEPMLTPRENPLYRKMSPEEDRTLDAVDSEPKHYQQSYSGPPLYCFEQNTMKGNKLRQHYSLVNAVFYVFSPQTPSLVVQLTVRSFPQVTPLFHK